MKSIYVKNTQNIKIGGQPSLRLEDVSDSKTCGVLPAQIPHIKPKLFVKEGNVKVGTPLFYDKQDPRIKFLSVINNVNESDLSDFSEYLSEEIKYFIPFNSSKERQLREFLNKKIKKFISIRYDKKPSIILDIIYI